MSEKELTKGAKRILDDTEEPGTWRWGEFTIKHMENLQQKLGIWL